MHRRVGEFYENELPDALNLLRAALHLQRCGEHARALRIGHHRCVDHHQSRSGTDAAPCDRAIHRAAGGPSRLGQGALGARASLHAARRNAKSARELRDSPGPGGLRLRRTRLQARACLGLENCWNTTRRKKRWIGCAGDWRQRKLARPQKKTALHIRMGDYSLTWDITIRR